MDMWLVFYWTGPIGVGVFLVCLGAMIFLLTKADEVNKRTKAMMKEKGFDKKQGRIYSSNYLSRVNPTRCFIVKGSTCCEQW